MPRYGYGWGASCSCPCTGPAWAVPTSRNEFMGELEDYKVTLETEIATLEKRIKALKEKGE